MNQMSTEKWLEGKQSKETHKPCLFPRANVEIYFLPKPQFLISTVSQAKRLVCSSQFQLTNSRPKSISGFLDARGGTEARVVAARTGNLQLFKFRSEGTLNLSSKGA
jgi:hypothetical protein